MPDNTESGSIDYIKQTTQQNLNHVVRHDPETKGIVNIEARTDGKFDVSLHTGTQDEARTIEGVSKDKLLKMMEEQL